MKHSVLISLLAALVIILSFSFAAYGKDDYETPIIPVNPSGSVTEAPSEDPAPSGVNGTTIDPNEPTQIDEGGPETTTAAPAEAPGVLTLAVQAAAAVFRAVLNFFRSIFGGLFA